MVPTNLYLCNRTKTEPPFNYTYNYYYTKPGLVIVDKLIKLDLYVIQQATGPRPQ